MAGMAVRLPFLRWIYQKHPRYAPGHGGFFYMIPVRGPWVRVAQAIRRGNGSFFYKAYKPFKRAYRDVLGLGHNLLWILKKDVEDWLQSLVHNSFVRQSVPGLGCCWYIKHISHANLRGPVALPEGCATDMDGMGKSIWILIKHGPGVWPVRVVDNMMRNGWAKFRKAHLLQANYNLIMVCESRWIFTAIILDADGKQVWYNWAELVNPFWSVFDAPQEELHTGFPLSLLEYEYPLWNLGYVCLDEMNYQQAFEQRLDVLLDQFFVESVVVKIGYRSWTLFLHDGHFDPAVFAEFMAQLDLQTGDYLFLSVLPNLEIRLVIFDGIEDKEKLYD